MHDVVYTRENNSEGGGITLGGVSYLISGYRGATHKYSEVTDKYTPINIRAYIPEDSPSGKQQGLSVRVEYQKERAVYGCSFKMVNDIFTKNIDFLALSYLKNDESLWYIHRIYSSTHNIVECIREPLNDILGVKISDP